MEQALLNAGLTTLQAHAYMYIIESFPVSPARLAARLKLTRTNAYKLADKLIDMGLVAKSEENKKIVYTPTDPIALSSLVAEARTKMIALEKATREAMRIVKNRITRDEHAEAKVYQGRDALIELFKEQAALDTDLYFISTPADLPVMGFDTMHQIRRYTGPARATRFGITPDIPGAVTSPKVDSTSRLIRTWLPRQSYTSPVEWSVCADELRLFVYADEPYIIKVTDKHVADAFRQLWHIIETDQRSSPEYKKLPRYANRTV